MGVQDVLDSAVNVVKNPVTNALKSSYSLGSVAVTKISNAVRGGGGGNGVNDHDEKLMKENPNPETLVGQEKIIGTGGGGGGEGEMGRFAIRDMWGSAVGGVTTPVSNVLKSSYSLGSAAVSKIDDVVRGGNGVEKLKDYIPGPEGQEKIGRALTHPATKEFLKLVVPPGGVGAYNVAAALLNYKPSTNAHINEKYAQVMEQLKVLTDENDKMRADLEHINKELEYSHNKLNRNTTTPARYKSSAFDQKPEDVISVFMMKGLKVRDFMDNQVVPPIRGPVEYEGWER